MLSRLVVDDELTPQFEAVVARTCEEAIARLELGPVDELWLNHNLRDAAGIESLTEFLLETHRWADDRVHTIVLFSEDPRGAADLERELSPHYTLRRESVTPELFTVT